jgi:ABC-2 type transport system permease protein
LERNGRPDGHPAKQNETVLREPNPIPNRREPGRLLASSDEARLFWFLRWRLVTTLVVQAFQSSRLRLAILIVLSVIFWGGLYFLFAEGFQLLQSAISHAATRTQTVHAIYNVFFLALLVMLSVSSAIIFFSSLYRSEEVGFLLTTPTSAARIVIYKFQETVLFSCWGFLLLGSPMLVAYGVVLGAPLHYFVMLLPFMLSFVFVPSSVGALLCMLFVYWLPSIRIHALLLVVAAFCVFGLVSGWSLVIAGQENMLTPAWLDGMLTRLEFAQQRLLPSWWLSSGLLEAANPEPTVGRIVPWRDSVMFLGLLISNSLLCVVLLVGIGRRLLRISYSRLKSVTPPPRSVRPVWIDRIAWGLSRWLPLSMRMLLVKDLRVFRRDPVQWSQFLVFFGLLALYFLNIRRFQYGEPLRRWMNMIGFLNLGVVGLILSTFTTRFIFPMISLEGRRFWILGSLPIRRDTVLWSKLLFAFGGSILPCAGLIFLSDVMLGIVQQAPHVALIHQVTCWVLCLGLSSIAVGLGARLPDLRQASPSRIAAGFGGTLNLVLSALFIVACVLVTAVPSYFFLEASEANIEDLATRGWWGRTFGLGTGGALALGVGAMLILGALATIVPLRLGFRAFRRLEF